MDAVTFLAALEKPLLVLLGVVAGGFMGPVTDRLRARTGAGWWEAQERWRFKAQIYAKALTTLKRMRQPLELAAITGRWPDDAVWTEIEAASRELFEPSVMGSIWLSREAVTPLETQGTRLLDLARQRGQMTDKQLLMKLCEVLQSDIEALQSTAQQDLRLRLGA